MVIPLCFLLKITTGGQEIPYSGKPNAGHDVCLSEMIFSSLYESLSDGVTQLKNLGEKVNVLISGPIWLLQLWLNATFEASLPSKGLVDEDSEEVKNMRVKGVRLAQLTPNDEGKSLRPTFLSYVMMFARRHEFTSNMALFAARKYGSTWFKRHFPSPAKKQETKSLLLLEAFLTPKLITLRLHPSKIRVTLIAYQPNLVAQQFGLVHSLLKCLYEKKSNLLLYNVIHNETTVVKQID